MFNITMNLTNITNSYVNVCELNQIAMLNQIDKMPTQIFIMIALSFVALVLYILVTPYLDKKVQELVRHICIMFATGTLLFGLIFLGAVTFNISGATWITIEKFLSWFVIAFVLLIAFIKRKKLLKFIGRIGEHEV